MRIIFMMLSISFFGYFSCVSKQASDTDKVIYQDTTKYQVGDTIYPFSKFDFNSGKWVAKINIHKDDKRDLPDEYFSKLRISTDDPLILEKLKDCGFIYTGSDMATLPSTFKLYHDGKIMAEYEIVLEDSLIGLQCNTYGWITACESFKTYQAFKLFN